MTRFTKSKNPKLLKKKQHNQALDFLPIRASLSSIKCMKKKSPLHNRCKDLLLQEKQEESKELLKKLEGLK